MSRTPQRWSIWSRNMSPDALLFPPERTDELLHSFWMSDPALQHRRTSVPNADMLTPRLAP